MPLLQPLVGAFRCGTRIRENRETVKVRVILFGATGMVGQGVLRECLLDPDVERVLAILRNSSLPQHDKLRESRTKMFLISRRLRTGCQAATHAFSPLVLSAVGMKEEAYRRLTYDLTVSVARTLAKLNPDNDLYLRIWSRNR